MQLAHAGDDRLARLLVGTHAERGVFLRQAPERDAHLFLVGLGLRLNRLRDDRIGELHLLERDDLVDVADRLAGGDVLHPHRRRDVARANLLDFLALVRVHLQQAADPLLPAAHRRVHGVARLQHSGVNADERQLAYVRVGRDLERQPGKRLAVFCLAHVWLAVFLLALHRRNVRRRGQIVDHRVEHRLHALVLERGTAQHRHDLVVERADADASLDLLDRQLAGLEVLVHQLFVRLGRGLDHLLAPLLGLVSEIGGDILALELHPLGRLVPVDRLHRDEVDDALKLFLGADRELDRNRVGLQAQLHLVVDLEEVRADTVHLVDEGEPRHAVLGRLAPNRLGLRLHAADRAEHHARAIEHAQRPLDLDREVDVPGGVDDVDVVFRIAEVHPLPVAGGRRGSDRDAALLLLLHPVHRRCAVVHLADLMVHAGVEQNALGGRGLARIDMRADADVAIALDWSLTCHSNTHPIVRSGALNIGAQPANAKP